MTEPHVSTAETEDIRAMVSRMGEAYSERERKIYKMAQTMEQMNTSVQSLTQVVARINTTPQAPVPAQVTPSPPGPQPGAHVQMYISLLPNGMMETQTPAVASCFCVPCPSNFTLAVFPLKNQR